MDEMDVDEFEIDDRPRIDKTKTLKIGTRLRHDHWGDGTLVEFVTVKTGAGPHKSLKILFDKSGTRVLNRFVEFEILES